MCHKYRCVAVGVVAVIIFVVIAASVAKLVEATGKMYALQREMRKTRRMKANILNGLIET